MAEDVSRLPKWAQQRIAKLEQDVEHYRDEAAVVSAGESDTWIETNEPNFGTKTFLPSGSTLCFLLRGGGIVKAYVRRGIRDDQQGKLDINGLSGSLIVEPRAANSLYITTER